MNWPWIMDVVYNPIKTTLLSAAERAGTATLDGLGMLVHQGAAGLHLWTRADPPLETMRDAVRARLE